MNHRDILLQMIGQLLSGSMTVPEFRDKFYFYFLDEVPDNILSDSDGEFFSEVQEKLDWVADDPSQEEQKYGWLDNKGYVEWLRERAGNYNKKDR